MDGIFLLSGDGSAFIDGVADNVHDAAEGLGTDGDTNGGSSVVDFLSADESFSGVHGDSAHSRVSQVLCDFEDESVLALDALNFKSVEDRGDFAFELHIDDGTDDLGER